MTDRDIEDIKRIAEAAEDPFALMGSIWGKDEADVMIWQTIHACVINLKEHGQAFSFNEVEGENRLAQNCSTYLRLVRDGYFTEGGFGGRITIIPTRKLLDALLEQLNLEVVV